jgi:hypothetical protein
MKIMGFCSIFVLCFLFLSSGCQTTSSYSKTAVIAQEDRVPVPQGKETGTWNGKDLSVDYRYSREAGQIDLSGTVNFADHMTLGYVLLHDFRLGVIFTDEKGSVLEMKGLATDRGSFKPIPFHVSLSVPISASTMSFSYQGTAIEGGNDSGGGGVSRFWQNPVY